MRHNGVVVDPFAIVNAAAGDTIDVVALTDATMQVSIGNLVFATDLVFASSSVSLTQVVEEPTDLVVTALPITAVEGTPFVDQLIATFTDRTPRADFDPATPAGSYCAEINWGDGVTSHDFTVRIVDNPDQTFSVFGSHLYTLAGTYSAGIEIHEIDGTQANAATSATVTDAPWTTAGVTLDAVKGNTTGQVIVATITDENLLASIGHYSAVIAWGDGFVESGEIVQEGAGLFNVVSSGHTYNFAVGTVPVAVTVTDRQGDALAADSQVNVAGLTIQAFEVPSSADEGQEVTFAARAVADPSEGPLTDTWSFGDGTT